MATITHAALETDLRMASVLSQEIALMLADRTSIRTSGAVQYFGSVNGLGSDTKTIRLAGLDGYDTMESVADGADPTATTDITDASVAIAVSRYALQRDLTDIAELTGMGGADITPQRLAASAVGEAEKCFMDLVATAIATFGTDVGTSGSDATVDDVFSALATLQGASNSGPYYALLAPVQLSDLQSSIRAEAGALQFMSPTQEILNIKGAGYAGSFLGIDVYTSSQVTTAGGNRHGAIWAAGALGYCDAQPVISHGDVVRPAGSFVTVEFERNSSSALTEITSSAYLGLSVIQDGMGVGFVTDA